MDCFSILLILICLSQRLRLLEREKVQKMHKKLYKFKIQKSRRNNLIHFIKAKTPKNNSVLSYSPEKYS